MQEGVAVHHAIAGVFGVLQARNEPEDPLLFRPLQTCLEAHQVVQRASGIVLAQLHDGIGFLASTGID